MTGTAEDIDRRGDIFDRPAGVVDWGAWEASCCFPRSSTALTSLQVLFAFKQRHHVVNHADSLTYCLTYWWLTIRCADCMEHADALRNLVSAYGSEEA